MITSTIISIYIYIKHNCVDLKKTLWTMQFRISFNWSVHVFSFILKKLLDNFIEDGNSFPFNPFSLSLILISSFSPYSLLSLSISITFLSFPILLNPSLSNNWENFFHPKYFPSLHFYSTCFNSNKNIPHVSKFPQQSPPVPEIDMCVVRADNVSCQNWRGIRHESPNMMWRIMWLVGIRLDFFVKNSIWSLTLWKCLFHP